jgi:hypothetical protein
MTFGRIIAEPLARWTWRVGLFALTLGLAAFVLHRVGSMTTPVALNVALVVLTLSALALALGLWAIGSIWVRGRAGFAITMVGMIAALMPLLLALTALPPLLALPAIADITTDPANPPAFAQLARQRGSGANATTYGGSRVAALQQRAYPDLRPLPVTRGLDETFDLALVTVRGRRGLGWRVASQEPPTANRPGFIEATERTLVAGFTDDVVIRVAGRDGAVLVDVRSASRYGRHDLGANAARVRRFLREFQARLDATLPGSTSPRARTSGADPGAAKRPLARSPETKSGKAAADRAPQDVRRAPERKAPPRG